MSRRTVRSTLLLLAGFAVAAAACSGGGQPIDLGGGGGGPDASVPPGTKNPKVAHPSPEPLHSRR